MTAWYRITVALAKTPNRGAVQYGVSPDAPLPDLPLEWQPALDALRALPPASVALLVGAPDRGKTTFAALAARHLSGDAKVAVVDTDIGQSEIGPPGTVGWAWARPDAARLRDLKPAGVFFVGAFTPAPVAVELLAATAQALRHIAGRGGAHLTLVDTTGWVAGPSARRVKIAKAQTVSPALVIGMGDDPATGSLAHAMATASGAQVCLVATPQAVGRKGQSLRAARRLTRLAQARTGARTLALPLRDTHVSGAMLGTGEPLPPHLVQWASTALRLPIVHAEHQGETLAVFLSAETPRPGWEAGAGPVADHFGAETVRAVCLPRYTGAYVGLHDLTGRLLAVGRFAGLDAENAALRVSAPPPVTADRVKLLQFGRVRLADDGAFVGDIKPGEI